MIPLRGRCRTSHWASELTEDVWRVVDVTSTPGPTDAVLLTAQGDAPGGASLYLSASPDLAGPGRTLHLPEELHHVQADDVLAVSPDGTHAFVLWKSTARHSSILLTEQCDNYCLMCSQPPKVVDDAWLYARAKRLVDRLPDYAVGLALTGGEPTLLGDEFVDLLYHCAAVDPQPSLHVLSNGRRFAQAEFADRVAAVPLDDVMFGIPLYSSEPLLHDFVVQATGAFDETVRGILNLAERHVPVEIRVVVQKHTVPALEEIAYFISRNLPFVAQVALMGLEMTGLARPNSAEVWIDPHDYQDELRRAVEQLTFAGVPTRIYNHQLCVLDSELWPYAVQSISDWKNDYLEICQGCAVREQCGGVFTTSGSRLSAHLRPLEHELLPVVPV